MSGALVQSATILFREGLEAMLVIAALAGYLDKVGAAHRIKALYLGALAAVAASFVAAWIFAVYNAGQHDDTSEGIVIVLASAIMLYVSGWLMLKQDPKSWKAFIAGKADEALAKDTAWAVGALAFLSVFREGAETVLFITALANTEGGWTLGIFAGLIVGAVLLAVLFVVLNRVARRVPVAAAVRRHVGVPVPDGAEVHRRCDPGIPGTELHPDDAAARRRMAGDDRPQPDGGSADDPVPDRYLRDRGVFAGAA